MNAFSELENQIRECFGRVVYTHKTHEKMAEGCTKAMRRYKWAQIGVSALTASGALSVVFLDKPQLKLATAITSILTLLISGAMRNFDPGGTAQKHRDAAASLWPVRESYLSLLTDLRMGSIQTDEATRRREDLQKKLAAIYKGAPQTNSKAYTEAQTALKKNEEYTFSDAEIDKFLPTCLRKEKQ
jgi:hypothetical protein